MYVCINNEYFCLLYVFVLFVAELREADACSSDIDDDAERKGREVQVHSGKSIIKYILYAAKHAIYIVKLII